MDQVKIGQYIAGKRKGLGLTQRQLAEKLGMSDKSVSKWERGVCLPDVSVYSDLCMILGISINEFLAGEDIVKEDMIQKSEENIIGVVTDSKFRQKRLKVIICGLLILTILTLAFLGTMIFRNFIPQNYIMAVDRESIEVKTAELLSGADGAFLYQYVTSEEFDTLNVWISEYHAGELVSKEKMDISYGGILSPHEGKIILVPDFEDFIVKLVIADDGAKLSTEFPILENVESREYYGRSASEIREKKDIHYNEEQGILALIYDNDELSVVPIQDFMDGNTENLSYDDYVYYISVQFCK